jgi:hypothetical protein
VSGKPRRHHFVPQLYQRAFTNAKGQVRVVDLVEDRDYTTKTTNAFVETDYYTVASVETAEDRKLVEAGIYGRAESIAADALRGLVDGRFPPSDQHRMDLGGFMALQVTRGPHFRNFADHAAEKMGEAMQMAAAMAPPEYWERKRQEWEGGGRHGPEPPGPFTPEQQRKLARGQMGIFRYQAARDRNELRRVREAHPDLLHDGLDARFVRGVMAVRRRTAGHLLAPGGRRRLERARRNWPANRRRGTPTAQPAAGTYDRPARSRARR